MCQPPTQECWIVSSGNPLQWKVKFRVPLNMKEMIQGKFGDVFNAEARYTMLGFHTNTFLVAVKQLKPVGLDSKARIDESTKQMRKRLTREVNIRKKLKHPNIVPLLDYHAGGALADHFIVSPWYHNGNLRSWVERATCSRNEQFDAIEGIASGLVYLHHQLSKPIVHGDITPENIVLDAKDRPLIGDFGLCAMYSESTSTFAPSYLVGNPRWTSPERLEQTPPAPSDDVYAFGCIILFILTGKDPYHYALRDREFWSFKKTLPPSSPEKHSQKMGLSQLWWELMQLCWLPAMASSEPLESRPSMNQIAVRLERIAQTELHKSISSESVDGSLNLDEKGINKHVISWTNR